MSYVESGSVIFQSCRLYVCCNLTSARTVALKNFVRDRPERLPCVKAYPKLSPNEQSTVSLDRKLVFLML